MKKTRNLEKKEFDIKQGLIIKNLRKKHGYKQKEMGPILQISTPAYCLLERGKHGFSAYQLHKLHAFFMELQ